MLDLNKIRDNIDETDQAIIELFEKRMKLCEEVAEYMIETGKQVLDTTREKQKLEKVTSLATGDFNKKSVEELFKQIMAMSRKMQYQILERHGADTQVNDVITFEETEDINKDGARIVYQGLEGAYAHDAVCQYFGEDAECTM